MSYSLGSKHEAFFPSCSAIRLKFDETIVENREKLQDLISMLFNEEGVVSTSDAELSMLFNEEGVVSISDAELLRFLLRDAETSNDNVDVSTSNVCRAHQGKKGRKEA